VKYTEKLTRRGFFINLTAVSPASGRVGGAKAISSGSGEPSLAP
jgi:hypothetical protein